MVLAGHGLSVCWCALRRMHATAADGHRQLWMRAQDIKHASSYADLRSHTFPRASCQASSEHSLGLQSNPSLPALSQ
eukprot:1490425-Pleurochrysis_carterae.AAC.4